MRERNKLRVPILIILAILPIALSTNVLHSQEPPYDWRTDWEIEKGFSISIDTEGYNLPTSIAFVPEPGDSPQDPLYFVTEFAGIVKVVTNDRTVHTFADLQLDLPPFEAEAGMAGICLSADQGYVFVTFASKDGRGTLKNNIVRFDTQPNTFSITPTSQADFTQVFSPYTTGGSHQIGPCQVLDNLLYVSIGDGGFTPKSSQNLAILQGKIARMTLDGHPVPENPFYEDDNVKKGTNFVWAYGLRNPFGLKAVDDRLFVGDNGNAIDRFLEVEEGQNYLWDGNDWSIASKAAFVVSPSHGVVQLEYLPEDSSIFPAPFQNTFYFTQSGNKDSRAGQAGILLIKYDFKNKELLRAPETFLRYRGSSSQLLTGLAFGPDGLYAVPILPDGAGTTAVLRIAYDPTKPHPITVARSDGSQIIYEKGCTGCHIVPNTPFGEFSIKPSVGPSLERDELVSRLQKVLHSEIYLQSLEAIDQLDDEPFVSFRQARQEVRDVEGLERVRTWIKYRVQEPRFDNVFSRMPNLGVSEEEAILIADALLEGGEPNKTLIQSIKDRIFPERARRLHLAQYFAIGFILGTVTLAFSYLIFRRIRRAM